MPHISFFTIAQHFNVYIPFYVKKRREISKKKKISTETCRRVKHVAIAHSLKLETGLYMCGARFGGGGVLEMKYKESWMFMPKNNSGIKDGEG